MTEQKKDKRTKRTFIYSWEHLVDLYRNVRNNSSFVEWVKIITNFLKILLGIILKFVLSKLLRPVLEELWRNLFGN